MLKKLSLYLLLSANMLIFSNMPPGGFEPFVSTYFVETGTYTGKGIDQALKAGFKTIYSIELNSGLAQNAKKKFKGNSNVHIFHGNSATILYDVIKDINEPATFWLDGHNGTYDPHGQNCPVLEELDQINLHHIKTHTILIDDMHCAGKELFDFITKEEIIAKIKEINPDYEISYIAGGDDAEYPENIMVAQVK